MWARLGVVSEKAEVALALAEAFGVGLCHVVEQGGKPQVRLCAHLVADAKAVPEHVVGVVSVLADADQSEKLGKNGRERSEATKIPKRRRGPLELEQSVELAPDAFTGGPGESPRIALHAHPRLAVELELELVQQTSAS